MGLAYHCTHYVLLDSLASNLEQCAAESYADSRCGLKFSFNGNFGGECRCTDAAVDPDCTDNAPHGMGHQLYEFNIRNQ